MKQLLYLGITSIILFVISCSCTQNTDKEKELLKKELELAKKELKLEKQANKIQAQLKDTMQQSIVKYQKYSTPVEVLEALIYAARNEDLTELKNLCDPQEKGDIETLCMCRLNPDYRSEYAQKQQCNLDRKSFIGMYKDARIDYESEKVEIPNAYTSITLWNSNIPTFFQLVKRHNKWYLFTIKGVE